MFAYKIDVLKSLKERGYNTSRSQIFSNAIIPTVSPRRKDCIAFSPNNLSFLNLLVL